MKIQYPAIGRSIRSDFRNLSAFLLPLRLGRGWEPVKAQLEEVHRVIEQETDYEREAEWQRRARSLFHEDDPILVPRVHDELSTRRVLTMEYLDGVHIHAFLAGNPPQERRDHFGSADRPGRVPPPLRRPPALRRPAPGQLPVPGRRPPRLPRLRLRPPLHRPGMGVQPPGRPGDPRRRAMTWSGRSAPASGWPRARRSTPSSWPGTSSSAAGSGDRTGMTAPSISATPAISARAWTCFSAIGRARIPAPWLPMNAFIARWYFGMAAMLYRLRARVDVRAIYLRERVAAGWGPA